MPDDETTTETPTDENTATGAATDVQPAAPAATQAAPPAATPAAPVRSTVTVPTAAMARIKREARAAGAEAVAKELGFESVDAMKAHYAAAKKKGAAPTTPAPKAPAAGARPGARAAAPAADDAALTDPAGGPDPERQARINRVVRDRARLKKENAELQERLDAVQAEGELKIIAMRAGISDVDYALALAKRHLAGLDDAAVAAFDEVAYFEGLRKSHPVIFAAPAAPAETQRPVSTTTGGAPPAQSPNGARPPAPPTNKNPAPGSDQPADARTMTREQLKEHLRKRGLQDPTNAAF